MICRYNYKMRKNYNYFSLSTMQNIFVVKS